MSRQRASADPALLGSTAFTAAARSAATWRGRGGEEGVEGGIEGWRYSKLMLQGSSHGMPSRGRCNVPQANATHHTVGLHTPYLLVLAPLQHLLEGGEGHGGGGGQVDPGGQLAAQARQVLALGAHHLQCGGGGDAEAISNEEEAISTGGVSMTALQALSSSLEGGLHPHAAACRSCTAGARFQHCPGPGGHPPQPSGWSPAGHYNQAGGALLATTTKQLSHALTPLAKPSMPSDHISTLAL